MPTLTRTPKSRPCGWIVIGLASSWPHGVPSPCSCTRALRKLHALLVIDTRSGLGESVKVDGERIDHLLSENLPADRAEVLVLTGKDASAEAILSYYRRLNVGRDDSLLFYYAGHGATDPQKGQFLALQDLAGRPLLRAELRTAMQSRHPGLIVIMTDCCSTRFSLPGKSRRVVPDKGTAAAINPLLKCLLYQSRGVVDITAASGNASFGDDHEGGIFTAQLRAYGRRRRRANRYRQRRFRVVAGVFRPAAVRALKGSSSPGRTGRLPAARMSIKRRKSPWPSAWGVTVNHASSESATIAANRWNTNTAGPAADRGHTAASRPRNRRTHRAAWRRGWAPAARGPVQRRQNGRAHRG